MSWPGLGPENGVLALAERLRPSAIQAGIEVSAAAWREAGSDGSRKVSTG